MAGKIGSCCGISNCCNEFGHAAALTGLVYALSCPAVAVSHAAALVDYAAALSDADALVNHQLL